MADLDKIMGDVFGAKTPDLEHRAPRGVQLDTTLQPRAEMDMELVEDYAERMYYLVGGELVHVGDVGDAELDTWDVFDEHGKRWEPGKAVRLKDNTVLVWDGHHRTQAARQAGAPRFPYLIEDGNRDDAFRNSLGANYDHGKRRTRADKRRAAYKALMHDDLKRLSDSMIADITKLTQTFVSSVRRELEQTEGYDSPAVRINRAGQEFRPDNIGTKASAGPPAGSVKRRTKGQTVDLPTNKKSRKSTEDDAQETASNEAPGEQTSWLDDTEPGEAPVIRTGHFLSTLREQENASVDVVLTRGREPKHWRQLADICGRVVADEGYVLPFIRPDFDEMRQVVEAFEGYDFECAWVLTIHLSGTSDRSNPHGLPSTSMVVPVLARTGHELSSSLADSYTTQRSEMGLREVSKLIIAGLDVGGLAVDPMAQDGGLAAGARAAGMTVIAITQDDAAAKQIRNLMRG